MPRRIRGRASRRPEPVFRVRPAMGARTGCAGGGLVTTRHSLAGLSPAYPRQRIRAQRIARPLAYRRNLLLSITLGIRDACPFGPPSPLRFVAGGDRGWQRNE